MRYNEELTSKFFEYFTHTLELKVSTKGFYRGDCPFCHGSYTFGINPEKGKSNCFKCDEGKTSFFRLVMALEPHINSYHEVIGLINSHEGYGFKYKNKGAKKEKIIQKIDLPEAYNRIDMGKGLFADAARHYLLKRGFKLSKLVEAGIGYCDSGEYQGYIILPYYEHGRLVYFTSRRFIQIVGTKFKNPPEEDFGIGKTQLVYNRDSLWIYKTNYLFESITNALTMGNNAVVFGGKDISPFQFRLLITSNCQNYIIGLDPDALGKAYKLGMDLCKFKRVKVLELPEGTDVNSLGREKTLEIRRRTPWMGYSELYSKYLKFKNK